MTIESSNQNQHTPPTSTYTLEETPTTAVYGQEILPPTSVFVREILETLLFTFFVIWLVKSATQNFRIIGVSMLPTMHEGQYLIINKLSYMLDEPERGEIIVMHYPQDRTSNYIKRVIGLPGDTISISNGQVSVNGVVIDEPYINATTPENQVWDVPEDQFFVMGDNRPNSSDSRRWSYLPRADIIGRAWVVYWPPEDWQLIPHNPHPAVPAP